MKKRGRERDGLVFVFVFVFQLCLGSERFQRGTLKCCSYLAAADLSSTPEDHSLLHAHARVGTSLAGTPRWKLSPSLMSGVM
jgi:hypothetical protein